MLMQTESLHTWKGAVSPAVVLETMVSILTHRGPLGGDLLGPFLSFQALLDLVVFVFDHSKASFYSPWCGQCHSQDPCEIPEEIPWKILGSHKFREVESCF